MADSSGLTPEQEAVRRLLADARHDGPPPDEVVARLDETLAFLVAERGSGAPGTDVPSDRHPHDHPAHDRPHDESAHDRPARVVDLGSRRRRAASIGVLAAAAAVVAGIAVGQVLPRAGDDDASSSTASGSGGALSDSAQEGSADDSGGGGADASEPAPESLRSTVPGAAYPTLSSADTGLVQRVLDLRPAAGRAADLGSAGALGGCDLPRVGAGRRLLAQVDGRPGVVVFRRPAGSAQEVGIYVCGSSEPVRTLTLPAP